MPTLLILGAGGHGRVVADAAARQESWHRIVATDRDPARCSGELLPGVLLLSLEAALAALPAVMADASIHIAVGNSDARRIETDAVGAMNRSRLATVVHPQASVSVHALLGPGCFIAAQAVVGPNARLGAGVIVNHGAVVDHDAEVGDFSHIAPRAALGGGVRVGAGVLVGAGAMVLPGLRICDGTTIGAGAVVNRHVARPGVYIGLPARRIDER